MTMVTEYVPQTPSTRIRGPLFLGCTTVGLFVLGFGLWSAIAPLESAALGTGVVESETNRKTIQHLEGGVVGTILVREGETVIAGQPLIRLDDTRARTSLEALEGEYRDALATEARLLADRDERESIEFPESLVRHADEPGVATLLSGHNRLLETYRHLQSSREALIGQRIAQTKEEIIGLQAQERAAAERVALIHEEMADLASLVQRGLERKPRLLQLRRDLAELEGRRGDLAAQIARARQSIAEAGIAVVNLHNDAQKETAGQLRDTHRRLHELRERVEAARDVLARIELRAPEDGIVTDLRVHTPGGVVAAGEALMDLVPRRDRLIVRAELRPEDMDRVRLQLPAEVRLIPYKQRRTPPLEGTVVYVSPDRLIDKHTNQPYYDAKIRVDEAGLAALDGVEMLPGMPCEVMIKTGKTTVALYALSPILDGYHRAFREK